MWNPISMDVRKGSVKCRPALIRKTVAFSGKKYLWLYLKSKSVERDEEVGLPKTESAYKRSQCSPTQTSHLITSYKNHSNDDYDDK